MIEQSQCSRSSEIKAKKSEGGVGGAGVRSCWALKTIHRDIDF